MWAWRECAARQLGAVGAWEARRYLAGLGVGARVARRCGVGYLPDTSTVTGSPGRALVVPEVRGGEVIGVALHDLDTGAEVWVDRLGGGDGRVLVAGPGNGAPSWLVVTRGVVNYLLLAQWAYPVRGVLKGGSGGVVPGLGGVPRVYLVCDREDGEWAERNRRALGEGSAVARLPRGARRVVELADPPDGPGLLRGAIAVEGLGMLTREGRVP